MLSCKLAESNGSKVLIITLDLQSPTPSKSGQTLVVASTHGNQAAGITVEDGQGNKRPLIVGVNAYLRK